MIWMHDLVDPDDSAGRTYKQVNATRAHALPLGTLVEILPADGLDAESGLRLYIVRHDRDCDMTPLYALAIKGGPAWTAGWSQDALRVCTRKGAT